MNDKPCGTCGSPDRNAQGRCRPCTKRHMHNWYLKNKGLVRERSNQWRYNNKERTRELSRQAFRANPESYRAAYLRRNYCLSLDSYDQLLKGQRGVCWLCQEPPRKKKLSVDHDHACCSGKTSCGECIRGLLCIKCNSAMERVDSSWDWLQRAASYRMGNMVFIK